MNIFGKIKKISFTKDVATLSSGSVFAQLLLLAVSPVLTRIYKPAEFGVLAALLTFVFICVTFANGKFEQAVLLPKEDSEAKKLVRLSIKISICVTFLLLIVFTFTYHFLGNLLNLGYYDWLLLFVPFFVLLNAIFESLKYYCLRNKMFKQIALSVFLKAFGVVVFQVAFGLLEMGALGLVLGSILSLFLGNQQLIKVFSDKSDMIRSFRFSFADYKSEIRRYAEFPKFLMPSALLNATSLQLPVLFFSIYFSASTTGFFSLTHRVLGLPMSLLGNAVGDAYVQKANELKDDKKKLKETTWLLYKTLLCLGVVPTAVLFYFGNVLFVTVFGKAWSVSGDFASILSFWILFVFISSPISKLLLVNEKQKEIFIFQSLVFISRLLLFLLAVFFKTDSQQTMIYFSALGSVIFLSLIFYILVKLEISPFKILGFTSSIIFAGFFLVYLISLWLQNLALV